MSTVRGFGRKLGAISGTSALIPNPSVFTSDQSTLVVADWFFQPGPPPVVKIPYGWLSAQPPLRYRPDKPFTTATVSIDGGDQVQQQNTASLAEYGDSPFTATLHSALPEDAPSLAEHMLAFYATQPGEHPRARMPSLTLNLISRTVAEMMTILGVKQGQRIEITDPPASWPVGMAHQIVEGIANFRSDTALVVWNTSPVIGSAPGVAGPWFRTDVSRADGDHVMPY